jgi:hypothetical protein
VLARPLLEHLRRYLNSRVLIPEMPVHPKSFKMLKNATAALSLFQIILEIFWRNADLEPKNLIISLWRTVATDAGCVTSSAFIVSVTLPSQYSKKLGSLNPL